MYDNIINNNINVHISLVENDDINNNYIKIIMTFNDLLTNKLLKNTFEYQIILTSGDLNVCHPEGMKYYYNYFVNCFNKRKCCDFTYVTKFDDEQLILCFRSSYVFCFKIVKYKCILNETSCTINI